MLPILRWRTEWCILIRRRRCSRRCWRVGPHSSARFLKARSPVAAGDQRGVSHRGDRVGRSRSAQLLGSLARTGDPIAHDLLDGLPQPRCCATSGTCWSAPASCPHATSTWSGSHPGLGTCRAASLPTRSADQGHSRTSSCSAGPPDRSPPALHPGIGRLRAGACHRCPRLAVLAGSARPTCATLPRRI